jgi:hypothetical protein
MMCAKQASIMHYNQQGDLQITIPRAVLKKFEASVLFRVVSDLQKDVAIKRKTTWDGDSIANIISCAVKPAPSGAGYKARF